MCIIYVYFSYPQSQDLTGYRDHMKQEIEACKNPGNKTVILHKIIHAYTEQLSQKCIFNSKNTDISGLDLVELGYNNIVGEYCSYNI